MILEVFLTLPCAWRGDGLLVLSWSCSVGRGQQPPESRRSEIWVSSSVGIAVLVLQDYEVHLLDTGQQGLGAQWGAG